MDRVRVEQKSVTYILDAKRIRMTRYEPSRGRAYEEAVTVCPSSPLISRPSSPR